MRPHRQSSFTFVGVLAGVTLGGAVAAVADPPAGGTPSPQIDPPGRAMAQGIDHGRGTQSASAIPPTPTTPDVKAVQDLLSQAATDATTPGHLGELLGLFSTPDRDRIGPLPAGGWGDVEAQMRRFQSVWQAQFGTSFNLTDKVSVVFSEPSMHIAQADPVKAPPPTTLPDSPPAVTMATETVVLTGITGAQVVRLHLLNEAAAGGGKPVWRVQAPRVTAATLHDSLLRQMTALNDSKPSWPTGVDQAYVYAAHHVAVALRDAGGR